MLTAIRNRIARRRAKRAARDRYDDHAAVLASLLWEEDYNEPERRIANLGLLAYTARSMAIECRTFDSLRTDGHGSTPAQWHDAEAALYILVRCTETDDYGEVDHNPLALPLRFDPAVDVVLHQLEEATALASKGMLLLRLHDAVLPLVGTQAAEALASLSHVYLVNAGVSDRDARRIIWGRL